MDIQSYKRWYDYSRARDSMLETTHSTHAPWHIIDSNDKKTARLNAISLILSQFPYEKIKFDKPKLGKQQKTQRIQRAGLEFARCTQKIRFDQGITNTLLSVTFDIYNESLLYSYLRKLNDNPTRISTGQWLG